MRKILSGLAAFVAGIVFGLILNYGPLHAQGSVGESDIMSKLNEISKAQEEAISVINSMKEDIRIIKIRVTQSQ